MKISLYDSVENTVVKGENAGYQHFLLFPQCFPKPSSLKLCGKELSKLLTINSTKEQNFRLASLKVLADDKMVEFVFE